MPPKNPESNDFPFLTRQMLDYDQSAVLGLSVDSFSDVAGAVEVVGFTRQGLIKFSLTTNATGASQTDSFRVPDFPILLSVRSLASGIGPRRCYVAVYMTINGERVARLIAGYVSNVSGVSWPADTSEDSESGMGALIRISGADPAAGAEVDDDVFTDERVRFRAALFTLVTDATAANRRPHFVITHSSGSVMYEFFASVDQAASLTRNYHLAPYGHIPDEIDDNDILIAIPNDLQIDEGYTISTVTTNLQAGDNWGTPRYYVEKWRSQ